MVKERCIFLINIFMKVNLIMVYPRVKELSNFQTETFIKEICSKERSLAKDTLKQIIELMRVIG